MKKKKIVLLATGGTIASTPSDAGLLPTLGAQQMLEAIQGDWPFEVRGKDIFMMDSSNIQPEEWTTLAQAVDCALIDADGVVITHGTDTMAYTASALSFMLAGVPKPVILTGSQLPLFHPLSDARGNLLQALFAAAQGTRGVYVCFRDKLISGVHCVKTHTTSMAAFSSVNAPLAGYFDVEGIHFTCPQPYTPLIFGEGYCLRSQLDSRVFLLKLVPGTSPDVLRFVANADYQGLVIEAFGLGGLHYIRRNLVKALAELNDCGVQVMAVSQCLHEKANLHVYEVGRELCTHHVFSGHDMTTEAAVCKMMWALRQPDPRATLAHSWVGEFSAEENKKTLEPRRT